ncbi:MAG: hypothetical protein EXQ91_04330 [Alphaproteobacteria bacterium]|nr:hypothetical protein [Alphaproteobacteria bacterium]
MVQASGVEFSRLVSREEFGRDGFKKEFAAGPEECATLARRFGLVAIRRFSVKVVIETLGSAKRTRAHVDFAADVVQSCVVTLDLIDARVVETFSQDFIFSDAPAAAVDGIEREVDVVLEEEPEFVYGDAFDIGELAAQQLALALDPYPRKPGASFPGYEDRATTGAFAALAALKKPMNEA